MIKMIVFLGNPGKQYEKTRHNLAWMLETEINRGNSFQKKFKGEYYKHSQGIIILKPQTFMNKSGESIQSAASFFRLSPQEILIVHDDLETGFGSLKIKKGGGLGGHNGLKSASEKLGTKDFYRLALGISRPSRESVSSYVLSRFNQQEEAELPLILQGAERSLERIIRGDLTEKKETILHLPGEKK